MMTSKIPVFCDGGAGDGGVGLTFVLAPKTIALPPDAVVSFTIRALPLNVPCSASYTTGASAANKPGNNVAARAANTRTKGIAMNLLLRLLIIF